MTIDLGTSSVVASLSCLVELLLAIFWAVFTGFSRFYASPRICSSFRNRKEPMAHFQNAFFFVFGSSIGDNGFENTFKTLLTDANKLFLQAKGH